MVTTAKVLSDQRKSALITGISLIIMAIAAGFSYGLVHSSLLVQGDASATLQNIVSQNNLFKAEIFGWLIVVIADIVVAWSIYIFLKPLNKNLSLLGAWFRLVYSSILGIAVMNLILVLVLTNNTTLFATDQLPALVTLFLEAFDSIWSLGLIVFGGHLLIIGWITLQSNSIPKWISLLLLLAAISYIAVHFCKSFFPQFNEFNAILESVLTLPMTVGELGFGLWLLFRGGRVLSRKV